MRRVVITGMGIRSCLGHTLSEVTESLREGRSGIRYNPQFDVMDMHSTVSGSCGIQLEKEVPKNLYRFMGQTGGLAYLSLKSAIEDAGLSDELVQSTRTGVVMGSSSSSSYEQGEAADMCRDKGVSRGIGHTRVFKTMNSAVSANMSTAFKIRGMSYTMASACSTSLHSIGNAMEQIQLGNADIVFAGGAEDDHWTCSGMLDIIRGLSCKYNDTPEKASRPYDKDRDGFVIGSGSGAVVVEDLDHALARGAKIYAEIIGYAATSDGADIVAPSGEGAARCMQLAIDKAGIQKYQIDYINAHGTSTPQGDIAELEAIGEVFGEQPRIPYISSTKSLSGHAVGAAGVHEVIYSILMAQNDFMAASANIENLDPKAEGYPILQKRYNGEWDTFMTNSFGFGGTNGCAIIRKWEL